MKQVTVALDVFLGYTHHGYVSKTHNSMVFDNAVNDVWFSYERTGFDPCCMVQTGTYTYQILNIE